MLTPLTNRAYLLLRRVMFTVDPERIHSIVASCIALLRFSLPNRVVRRLLSVDLPELRSTVFGVEFPAPVGLAAGFDKDGSMVDSWGAMGFGFAEIGTVTGQGQPGNPQPRLFRLPDDRALINRMGFNNPGAGVVAARLRERRADLSGVPIGINIGKTKIVDAADAAEDYRYSARMLGGLGDFVVVNVSSPNTPGLRDLQAVSSLRPLLTAVLDEVRVPVLVKIAPDLADSDIDDVADLAVELGLAGMVCTNTTIDRTGLRTDSATVEEIGAGGLSGAPLHDRSLEVLRRVYRRTHGDLPIISVGGIETADQAWDRLRAGASLVQGYTGFIYGGPLWAKTIHLELARRLRSAGYRTISDVVGTAVDEQ